MYAFEKQSSATQTRTEGESSRHFGVTLGDDVAELTALELDFLGAWLGFLIAPSADTRRLGATTGLLEPTDICG